MQPKRLCGALGFNGIISIWLNWQVLQWHLNQALHSDYVIVFMRHKVPYLVFILCNAIMKSS